MNHTVKSPQKIWFTSDSHWGHQGVIANRKALFGPGDNFDLETHDRLLIERWNAVVKKNDTVYHAGDFAWKRPLDFKNQLNGHVHLILGNHDRIKAYEKVAFTSVSDFCKKVKIDNQIVYVTHYAMRVWNRSHYGTWNLYGHSHGSLEDLQHLNSFDIGVDCHGFRPIEFEEVRAIMAKKQWKPVDHHGQPRKEEPHV